MSNQTNSYYVNRRQQNWSRNQNTTRYVSAIKLGPVAHTVLVALMIIVLGLIYVTQATRTTGYDYEMQKSTAKLPTSTSKKANLKLRTHDLLRLKLLKTVV